MASDRIRVQSKEMLKPTLHRPVPMNTRVRLPEEWLGKPAIGTVVGIANIHVVFQYIVLLDTPVVSEFGEQSAVVCGGPQLESEDGSQNWRFDDAETRSAYLKEI